MNRVTAGVGQGEDMDIVTADVGQKEDMNMVTAGVGQKEDRNIVITGTGQGKDMNMVTACVGRETASNVRNLSRSTTVCGLHFTQNPSASTKRILCKMSESFFFRTTNLLSSS